MIPTGSMILVGMNLRDLKMDKHVHKTSAFGSDNSRILIIGLGEIGYSNAEYMTKIGLSVDGYDISDAAIKRALKAGIIKNAAVDFKDYDYYLICISTHRPDNMAEPFLDGLYEITYKILRESKKGSFLGIDSTIPRGTTQKIYEILNHKLHVAHVPHRYYKPERDTHGVNQKRVVGACKECCYKEATNFYGKILGIPLYYVKSADVAEMTKIAENTYRYVQIAYAEELKLICENNNLNFEELRNAINTKWNIQILQAMEGIGGHCLPKDSQMLLDLSKKSIGSSIIEAAKKIDVEYRTSINQRTPQKSQKPTEFEITTTNIVI